MSANESSDKSRSRKMELVERVAAELHLDLNDPFTKIFAHAAALSDLCEEQARELAELRQRTASADSETTAALRELVRLKEIKDALDDNDAGVKPMRADVWASMAGDYETNKPIAWKRAREALAETIPSHEPKMMRVPPADCRSRSFRITVDGPSYTCDCGATNLDPHCRRTTSATPLTTKEKP